MPEIYTFNNNKENWKINASEITSISGDDLKIYAKDNQNIVFKTSGTVNIENHLDILNNLRSQKDIKLTKDLILDTSNVSIKTPNYNYVIKCGEDLLTKYIEFSNQWIDLSDSGYKIDVTPETKNSKILLNFNVTYNVSEINNQKLSFRLKRFKSSTGQTDIVVTDNMLGTEFAFGVQDIFKFIYLDEPNINTKITYYLEVSCNKLGSDLSDIAILGYNDNKYNNIIAYQIYIPDISNSITKAPKKPIDVSFADKINNEGLFNNIDASKVSIDNCLNITGTTIINNIIDISSYIYSKSGNIEISGNISTKDDKLYDLGSSNKKFKHVFLSTESLYFRDKKVSIDVCGNMKISDDSNENLYINFDSLISDASFGNIDLSDNLIMSNNTNVKFLSSIDLSVNEKLTILNDVSINETIISSANNVETIVYNNDLSINNINSNNLIINVSNIDVSSIVTQDFINKNDISFNTVTIKQKLDISSLKITDLTNNQTITSQASSNLFTDLSVNTKIDISQGSIILNNNNINLTTLNTQDLSSNYSTISNLVSNASLDKANINNLIIKNKLNVNDVSCNEIETSGNLYVNNIELENDKLTIEASNVVIEGSLIVEGSQTKIESNNIEISFNQIKLASNESDNTRLNESGINISNSIASIKYKNTNDEIEISSNLFEVLKDISAQNITIKNNLNYLGSNLPNITNNIIGTSSDLSLTLNELGNKEGNVLNLIFTHNSEKEKIFEAFDVSNLTNSLNINDISFIKNGDTYTISYNDLAFSDISRIFSSITTTGISLDIINNKVVLSLPQSLEPNTNIEFSGVTISNSLYISQQDISIARVSDLQTKLQNMKNESSSSSSSQITSNSKFSVDLNFNNNDNKNKIITYEKNKNKYIKTSDIVVSSENNLHQNMYLYLNPFKATLQQRIVSNNNDYSNNSYTNLLYSVDGINWLNNVAGHSNANSELDPLYHSIIKYEKNVWIYFNSISGDTNANHSIYNFSYDGKYWYTINDTTGLDGLSPTLLDLSYNRSEDKYTDSTFANKERQTLATGQNLSNIKYPVISSNNDIIVMGFSSSDPLKSNIKLFYSYNAKNWYNAKISFDSVSTNAIMSNILWDGNKFIANIRENTNIKYGYSYSGKEWYMNNDVSMNIGSNALATLQNNRNIDTILSSGRIISKKEFLETSSSYDKLIYSDDGYNWNEAIIKDKDDNEILDGSYGKIDNVAYNGNILVGTIGSSSSLDSSKKIIYSYTGSEWNMLDRTLLETTSSTETTSSPETSLKPFDGIDISYHKLNPNIISDSSGSIADGYLYMKVFKQGDPAPPGTSWTHPFYGKGHGQGFSPQVTHQHFVETAMNKIWFSELVNIDQAYSYTDERGPYNNISYIEYDLPNMANTQYPYFTKTNYLGNITFYTNAYSTLNYFGYINLFILDFTSNTFTSTNISISDEDLPSDVGLANSYDVANAVYYRRRSFLDKVAITSYGKDYEYIAYVVHFKHGFQERIDWTDYINDDTWAAFTLEERKLITRQINKFSLFIYKYNYDTNDITLESKSLEVLNNIDYVNNKDEFNNDFYIYQTGNQNGMNMNPFHSWQFLGYNVSIAIAKNKLLIGIAAGSYNFMSKDSSGNILVQYSLDTLTDNLVNDSSNFIPLITLKDIWGPSFPDRYSFYNTTVINSYNDEYLLLMTTSFKENGERTNTAHFKHMIFVLKYSSDDGKFIIDFSLNIPAVMFWYTNINYNLQVMSSQTASISDIGEEIIVSFLLAPSVGWDAQEGRLYFIIKNKETGKVIVKYNDNKQMNNQNPTGYINGHPGALIEAETFYSAKLHPYKPIFIYHHKYWGPGWQLYGAYQRMAILEYEDSNNLSSSSSSGSTNIVNLLPSNLEWTGSMFTMAGRIFAYSYNGLQWFNNKDVSSSNVKGNYGTLEYNNMITQDIKSNINSKSSNNEIRISANQIIGIGQGSKFYYSNDIFNWYNLNGEDTSINYLTNFKLNNINRNNISSNKVFDVSTGEYDTIIDNKLGLSYNGKMWLACGNTNDLSNTLAYSKDGYNWFNVGNNVSNILTRGYDITNNKKTWVAVGKKGTNGSIIYSNDGFSWCDVSNVSIQNSEQICSVVYGNDMFVAGAKGDKFILYYSRDAKNWTGIDISNIEGNSNIDSNYNSCTNLIYNGTSFVGLLQPENKSTIMDKLTIIYSSDGYNWNTIITPYIIPQTDSSNSLYSMDHNKDRVMVVGYRNILYSDNLIDWYRSTKVPILDNYKRYTDIVWTGELWLLSTNYEINYHKKLYYSKNGKVWNQINNGTVLQDTFIMKLGCTKSQSNIYLQHPIIAGCDGSTNTLIYSDDLYKWKGLGRVFSKECNDIKWNGNNWVAIGKNNLNNSEIKWSKDGIKWTNITFSNDISMLNSIACGKDSSLNDIMVIAGNKNNNLRVLKSKDYGKTWILKDVTPDIPVTNDLKIIYNNYSFILCADKIYKSSDLNNWESILDSSGRNILTTGNNLLFIDNSNKLKKLDLYNYTDPYSSHEILNTNNVECFGYNGEMFIVVENTTNTNINIKSYRDMSSSNISNTDISGQASCIEWTGKKWLIGLSNEIQFNNYDININANIHKRSEKFICSYDGINWEYLETANTFCSKSIKCIGTNPLIGTECYDSQIVINNNLNSNNLEIINNNKLFNSNNVSLNIS